MKGIYLAAYTAYHPDYDLVYQDINGKRDLDGDMLAVDLNPYDFIIASPPCNVYSRAAGNRHSDYAVKTAHLLPSILFKLAYFGKPFLVENVRNENKFRELGLFDFKDVYVFRIGRHTFWTNIWFYHWLPFDYEFTSLNPNNYGSCSDLNKRSERQGSNNVHAVVDRWLYDLHFHHYERDFYD